MTPHEIEKHHFLKSLSEREAKVREGLAKFIGDDKPKPEEPEVVHEVQPDPQPELVAEAPAPVAAPVTESPADPRESDPNYWRHRHLTTEGILKAERAKAQQLAEEAARLREEADRLRKESLDKSRKAGAELRERSLEQIDLSAYFTAKQIEEYGEEHLRTVLKGNVKAALNTIQPEVQAEMEQLRAEIESLRGNAAQTREQNFWAHIDSALPDWQAQQADAGFQAWLEEIDPVSGRTRDSYVKEAQQSLDAKRVVAIFKSYRSASPQPSSVPAAPSRPSAPPAGKPIAAELPPPPQKMRLADYKRFQQEVTQGMWRGRDKEAAEMDFKFQRALQAGNLV